jgi:aspartate/tyrosine/aromatic aminotransferase
MAPADPILSLTTGFKNDKFEQKVNLGVGAYRDENGKPFIFPVVKKAQLAIVNDSKIDMEYASIDGDAAFNSAVRGVLFGWDHPDVNSGRVASAQTLSGTGALRVVAEFLAKFRPAPIYISNPTWGNHVSVFETAGL